VVSSLGVALIIVNLIQYLVGAESYTFPSNTYGSLPAAINFGSADKPIPIRTVQIVIFVVCGSILSLLTYAINFSRFGKAMRSVAEDQVTASLLGINTNLFIVSTFFISSFLAGLAGTLVGSSVSISGPYLGITFGLKGLAVIVLGGLGSIPGAVLGGLLIGITEAFVPADYSAYKDAVAFSILLIMLLIKPEGLLGRRFIQKV
jgi:branched-chain amino acid transport system permease protein